MFETSFEKNYLNASIASMKSTVQFYISQDSEGYSASGVDLAVVTQAATLDELMVNIREAVQLHFENEEPASLGYAADPAVMANFEVSALSHA